MVERSGEMDFVLYGMEWDAIVEGVTQFKYLGRPLYQIDYDCPVVRRNFK